MVHKYLARKKPEFDHIDLERLQELLVTAEAGGRGGGGAEEEVVQQGERGRVTEEGERER